MKRRSIFILLVTTFVILFSSAGPIWSKTYRLGVPKGYSAPTYKQLFASLNEKGFVIGKNLMIVPIDLTGFKTEIGKKKIRDEIAQRCDIFFVTGDHLQILFAVELKTPLLFITVIGPENDIPPAMKANATGFYWDSTGTMFKRSVQLLPPDQRGKLGMTFFEGSGLITRVPFFRKACRKLSIDLIVKKYSNKDDIERVMREFKKEGIKGITLFPPAARKGELSELIKWQNQLKLPLLGQVRNHIAAGFLGGPAVDYKILAPKLTEYVIKLLQGRSPSQLPVNYLSRKFIVNLNTVKKLGIDIPQEVINQAEIVGLVGKQQIEPEELPPLVPGNFTLGVPGNIQSTTLPLFVKALAKRGYVAGKNLRLVEIDLAESNDRRQAQMIAKRINTETNLFFATGNTLPQLFHLPDLNTPVCFLATKETADNIPTSIQHNFTGVIRDSKVTIIKMILNMMPGTTKIGFIYQSGFNLQYAVNQLNQIAEANGVAFESRMFSTAAEIGPIMRELQQQHVDFIMLNHSLINTEDLDEIVKWQNKLRLPVVAQLKSHVEKGLLGGPVVDYDVILPILGEYTDKIFHGRRADSLPIYYSSGKYFINLRAANLLKVNIPNEVTAIAKIIH